MKPIILLIVLLLAFLGGDDILDAVGFHHHDFTSSFIFRLHPLTYLASILILYSFKTGQLKISDLFSKMKNETIFLLVCLFVIVFLWIMSTANAISFLFDALCLPVLLSILLKITDKKIFPKFYGVIYFSFFLNALLALIEKIRGESLLSDGSYYFKDYFRATALYGHPLNNALIMAVLTVVLFFGSKKTGLKMAVLISGLVSIFCFGARGALIGVFLGIFLNILYTYFTSRQKKIDDPEAKKGLIYLGVFAVICVIVLNTSLGDRIVALSHVDSSAETRVNAWGVFSNMSFSDLVLGFGTNEINHLQHNAGVDTIENFWIEWILRFGLLGTALLVFYLFRFLYGMMSFIKTDVKFTLLFVFFFVASTNNSLSTNTLVLSMFVLACYIFFDDKEEVVTKIPVFKYPIYKR